METVRNVRAMSVKFGVNELVYSPKTDLMMIMMMMITMMIIIIIIIIIIFMVLSMGESNESLTRSGFEFLKNHLRIQRKREVK